MNRLQEFFSSYKQFAWEKDINGMIGLYDDHVMIFDMWVQGYQKGLTEWSGVITEWLGSLGEERVNVTFEMIETNEGGDIGFGSALVTYQAIAPDRTVIRSMKNRVTIGFRKENSQWKVIHQHTSCPITPNLEAILNF
jgi:ketosteroid isomerase-like protein